MICNNYIVFQVQEALDHDYLKDGRMRFHSCMCTCCHTLPSGQRQFTNDLEPFVSCL